ncbi:MAG: LacI family DNA-binding transcriptional regulator [bacterium]
MKRVTLKEVAAEAGISISCTARALKGRAGISNATRERVRAIADKLGYRPDPILSALATYRESRRKKAFQGTIAYLANHSSELECLASLQSGDPFHGARERAAMLGYQLRYFPLNDLLDSPERFWKRLRNQGIQGVLIRSFPVETACIPPSPTGFHCVDLFSQPHSVTVSTVSSNHAQSMELVLMHLKKSGYEKPALILNTRISTILHHGWRMAFSVSAQNFKKMLHFNHEEFPVSESSLTQWIGLHRPDALLFCYSEDHMPGAKILSRWHREGIASLCMDLLDPDCGIAGIYQDRKLAGAEALSLLHGMLMAGGLVVVRPPTATLIPGTWMEGNQRIPRDP